MLISSNTVFGHKCITWQCGFARYRTPLILLPRKDFLKMQIFLKEDGACVLAAQHPKTKSCTRMFQGGTPGHIN